MHYDVFSHAFYTKHIQSGWRRAKYAGIITKDIEAVIAAEARKTSSQMSEDTTSTSSSPKPQESTPVLSTKDLATAFMLMFIGYAISVAWLVVEIMTRHLKTIRKRRAGIVVNANQSQILSTLRHPKITVDMTRSFLE